MEIAVRKPAEKEVTEMKRIDINKRSKNNDR